MSPIHKCSSQKTLQYRKRWLLLFTIKAVDMSGQMPGYYMPPTEMPIVEQKNIAGKNP